MFDEITNTELVVVCFQNYDNPTLEKQQEFDDDIKDLNISKDCFVSMKH